MPRRTVADVLAEYATFRFPPKVGQLRTITDEDARLDAIESENREAASHQADFDVPLYNVWKQQEKTAGAGHYGNSEVRWVDNLLCSTGPPGRGSAGQGASPRRAARPRKLAPDSRRACSVFRCT